MKMTETVSEPASFLTKEVRRIHFTEITKKDLAELYNVLNDLFLGRRNCKLWVCIGNHDNWFDDQKQLAHFVRGFCIAIQTIDADFLDDCGSARAGHPRV